MILHSDLLGDLEVSDEQVMEFPDGLFGFPECREFALVPAEREGLYWLQSVQYGTLVFLLVDPFHYFDDYAIDLHASDLRELHAREPADVAVFCIVTLPSRRDEKPTANLQGPLALNLQARAGKQFALSESEYGVRCGFEL
ncbi:MAG TPA: flagellar assembly protein FliW [Longimicrobiaceae bacterium]|nr:flagellar assembly protein FliW [Longimicrobiaceae bacterium]